MNTSDYLVNILKDSRTTMSLDQILAVCVQTEKHWSNDYAMRLLRRADVKINTDMVSTPKGMRNKVVSYEYAPVVVPQTVPELVNESLFDMFGELMTRLGFKVVAVLSISVGSCVLWAVWSIMEWWK